MHTSQIHPCYIIHNCIFLASWFLELGREKVSNSFILFLKIFITLPVNLCTCYHFLYRVLSIFHTEDISKNANIIYGNEMVTVQQEFGGKSLK